MIAELIERLEKAEGPDREIDMHISAFEAGVTIEQSGNDFLFEEEIVASIDPGQLSRNFRLWNRFERDVPKFTSSLDAALSLVERKLPGVHWSISNATVKPRANVWMPQPTRPIMGPYSSGATPALAVCLALLRALSTEA